MIKVEILSCLGSESFEVEAIYLPGTLGEFEVLVNHAPIISTLASGVIKWRSAEGEGSRAVNGGLVQLMDNNMKICVEE